MFYGPQGEFSHEVVNMGPNYYGAQLGLVVPSYVDVDSMQKLDANASMFDQLLPDPPCFSEIEGAS
ncbi:MAG: hypothetical protein GVY14_04190 [Spirochaetes bacterium]|nr:hypothetical protein [Spirochaetota bacterium]